MKFFISIPSLSSQPHEKANDLKPLVSPLGGGGVEGDQGRKRFDWNDLWGPSPLTFQHSQTISLWENTALSRDGDLPLTLWPICGGARVLAMASALGPLSHVPSNGSGSMSGFCPHQLQFLHARSQGALCLGTQKTSALSTASSQQTCILSSQALYIWTFWAGLSTREVAILSRTGLLYPPPPQLPGVRAAE